MDGVGGGGVIDLYIRDRSNQEIWAKNHEVDLYVAIYIQKSLPIKELWCVYNNNLGLKFRLWHGYEMTSTMMMMLILVMMMMIMLITHRVMLSMMMMIIVMLMTNIVINIMLIILIVMMMMIMLITHRVMLSMMMMIVYTNDQYSDKDYADYSYCDDDDNPHSDAVDEDDDDCYANDQYSDKYYADYSYCDDHERWWWPT